MIFFDRFMIGSFIFLIIILILFIIWLSFDKDRKW